LAQLFRPGGNAPTSCSLTANRPYAWSVSLEDRGAMGGANREEHGDTTTLLFPEKFIY